MKTLYGIYVWIKKVVCGKNSEEELKELIESMIGSALVLRPINIGSGDTIVLSCPKKLRDETKKYIIDSMEKFIEKKTDNVDIVIFEDGLSVYGVIKHGIDKQRPDIANQQPRPETD